MIELFKRKIWNDSKTVNTIAEGCVHVNPKIVVAACKFFLILSYDWESENEASSEDEQGDNEQDDDEEEQDEDTHTQNNK